MTKSCLSYWFPRLQAAGVPVPRTEIVRTSVDLTPLLDGEIPDGWGGFLAKLNVAIARLTDNAQPTPPFFLRTGEGSGKHQWNRRCYVDFANGSTLPNHVYNLVEWSHMVDFMGLPHDVWCVRELLPTKPLAILPMYGGFPLVKEMRGFIRDGETVCFHPYWVEGAIREGFPVKKRSSLDDADLWSDKPLERDIPDNFDEILKEVVTGHPTQVIEAWALLDQVARAFAGDGAWSVDVLWTERGLYITDMAEAHRSFHYDGCPKAKELLS